MSDEEAATAAENAQGEYAEIEKSRKVFVNIIRENIFWRIVYGIVPVCLWVGWLLLPASPLLWIGIMTIRDGDLTGIVFMVMGIIVCVLVVLLTKPLWHKCLFEKSFLGIEPVTMVQWNDDCIRFSGAYVDIEISPKDIKSYNVPFGIVGLNTMYSIRVVVNVGNTVKWLWINTTMPDKTKFLDYLESLNLVTENGQPRKMLRK